MKFNPLVSICIPTHNQNPTFLKKCIESAIQQTYKNIEIIINNNNTTNESLFYLKNLSKEAGDIIKIFTNEHTVSMRESFEQAIHNSTGDYLFILPSDDFIEKNSIEVLVNALHEYPDADCISGQWYFVDKEFNKVSIKKNEIHYESKEQQIYDSLALKNNYLPLSLIRSKYINSIDLSMNNKLIYAWDVFFTNEITLHGKVVVIDNLIANFQLYNLNRKDRVVDNIIDTSEILYYTINSIYKNKELNNKLSKKIIAKIILIHFKKIIKSLIINSLKLNITATQLINIIFYIIKISLSLMILLINF